MTYEDKNPLISIIVPIFQTEKYLEKCILSIIFQSYHNLEIILIDDGSTDTSPDICDKYVAMDPRVKVIHQKNTGLSQARNVGLRQASGDYIGFVDSDDWIEPNMYEVLMSALKITDADIAICNNIVESEKAKSISNNKNSFEISIFRYFRHVS